MTLSLETFKDYKKQIMSAKEEISGELAQGVVEHYESQLAEKSREIDELVEKSKKKNGLLVVVGGVVGAAIGAAGVIGSTFISSKGTSDVNAENQYKTTEVKFVAALADIQSKKGQELTNAIAIIDIHQKEVFSKNHDMQWPTIVAIANSIKNNSKASNKNYTDLNQNQIQRLINILKSRDVTFDKIGVKAEDRGIIDLSETYLYNIDLSNIKLPKTNFNRSILASANITNADLTGSFFTGADLRNADISGSNLTKAALNIHNGFTTDLIGVTLTGTNLKGANLIGAKLFHPNRQSQLVAMRKIKAACNQSLAKFDQGILAYIEGGKECKKSIN